MRFFPMNVVQQDGLATLKVYEAQGVSDSFRELGGSEKVEIRTSCR
jgi:hypothetical protein